MAIQVLAIPSDTDRVDCVWGNWTFGDSPQCDAITCGGCPVPGTRSIRRRVDVQYFNPLLHLHFCLLQFSDHLSVQMSYLHRS